MFSAALPTPKITPPPMDDTHFYKAGRFLSYFPQVNENGVAFEREKVQPILSRIIATTFDIQHIKPGYDVPDPKGFKNTTCGAILSYHEDEEGIDAVVKIEREVAKVLGITPEDISAAGEYGKFSQECEQNPMESEWIIVDKDDPTKILSRVGYLEGMAKGYRRSMVGKDGQWHYYTVNGNPVYISPSPLGFVGVGAVETPADPSALIYSSRMLSSFYPGMDADQTPPDFTATEKEDLSEVTPITTDQNAWASDFMTNPDLMMPSSVDFGNDNDEDDKLPNDLFAAVWEEPHPEKGLGEIVSKRALRVKDNDGDFDRDRLIAAYHALMGFRGNTLRVSRIPKTARLHAMAYIRQGLNATNKTKEKSNLMADLRPEDLAALQAKYDEIKGRENAKEIEIASLTEKVNELTAKIDNLSTGHSTELSARDEKITTLEATIKEYKDKELASSRLAELEAIHPFSDEERAEIVKELASVSDDRFENMKLRRELAKRDHTQTEKERALASRIAESPRGTQYIPQFDTAKAPKPSEINLGEYI